MTAPNIVLVVMDTARAADVDPSGDGGPMPRLAELGAAGTVFSGAVANAPWTLPSHGSIFSGLLPSEHGAHAAHKRFEHGPTFVERLRRAGYVTVGISNNTWISPEFGFGAGFDEFVTTWQLFQDAVDFGPVAQTRTGTVDRLRGILGRFAGSPIKNAVNLVYGQFFRKQYDDGSRRTNRLIRDRLADWTDPPEPLFLFVNYLEPHLEYDPPAEFAREWLPDGVALSRARSVNQDAWAYITGERAMTDRDFEILRGLYRAELSYLDTRIAELVDQFAAVSALDETVFVITSDHGENIGDHGLMDHQYSLADTLLRVPLVITGPGFDAGEEVTETVQLVDLFPTVLDIAGIANGDEGLEGRSLTDHGRLPDDRPAFAEYIAPQPAVDTLRNRYDCREDVSVYDRRLRSIRLGRYKYVRGSDGTERLVDVGSDPGERRDLREQLPDVRDRAESLLDARVESLPDVAGERVGMDPRTEDRLEDLGYLQ